MPRGSDKGRVDIDKDIIPYIKRFKNIYNEKGKLIQIIDESKMELMSELSYISGKLDTKVVYMHGEEKETIKYIYSEDYLIKEEYYSEPEILMKIIEYVNVRGRMCQRIISPARDNLKWYLSNFYSYHRCCDLYVVEEILTVELLDSVYGYLNEIKDIAMKYMEEPEQDMNFKYWMEITLLNPTNVDMYTYGKEIHQFIEKGKEDYNIDFKYFNY